MNKITELKNNSDPEYIANELFNLIKQKDTNISKDLDSFRTDISEQHEKFSQLFTDDKMDNTLLIDKKYQIELIHAQTLKFLEVFALLDKKLDNEMTNNSSLSASEKNDLNQEFLFPVRQTRMDFHMMKDNSEKLLEIVEKHIVAKKPSFLDKIKSIREDLTSHLSAKNKLK